jgi:hypothetical protein
MMTREMIILFTLTAYHSLSSIWGVQTIALPLTGTGIVAPHLQFKRQGVKGQNVEA